MTNQAPARRPDMGMDYDRPMEKTESIFDYLQTPKATKEIQKALGTGRDVTRYVSGLVTTLATQKPGSKILQCSPISILKCALTAAQLGLDLDAKGHAYLVPYGNVATIVPGYKGYIFKARQSAQINSIWIEAVYKCDQFRVVMGTDRKIEHYPDVSSKEYGEDSAITHFYACVKMRTGETEFEVMTRAQVQAIATGTDVWRKYFGEMGKKTVFRRLQKKLQLPETADLAALDDRLDDVYQATAAPAPEVNEKEIKAKISKHLKALGWNALGFKGYLAARGYAPAWDSLTAAQKVSVEYDLAAQATQGKK